MGRDCFRNKKFLTSIIGTLVVASIVAGQETKVQGLIVERSGATMTLKTQDSEKVVVALTPATSVDEAEGLFKLRKKELAMTALIPGLPVQVQGTMNDKHQLVADTVRFKGSDLKTAEDIQAGLSPTQHQVEANQAGIVATNKRFGELGEYNVVGEVTVYFGNGQVDIEPKYKPELMALAEKAQTVDGYIIQVQGYASAVGSAAMNQQLSSERADNVLTFLEQDASVPLTNVLAPGAMGTTNQVASNQTAEGQAENRRVVVRILQNKGIAG
jgi:outer membrane protein OmpA-like peptidoglycan-associated protein